MKIIVTEPQFKILLESSGNSNVVEKIMNHTGIKYDGHQFLERSYDNFGRTHDTVIFYFRLPDDDFTYSYYRRIHFLTRNNKIIRVDSAGDFRTIHDAFRYIPTDILMDYFIEKGKTYLEKFLPKRYPNDSLKESKEKNNNLLLETNLKQNLKLQIKDFGIKDSASLVGGTDNLYEILNINSPMEFLHLFDDLDFAQSEENSDFILYRYKPKRNLMIYNKNYNHVFINSEEIWTPLLDVGLFDPDIKELTSEWLSNVYNLKGVTTSKFGEGFGAFIV